MPWNRNDWITAISIGTILIVGSLIAIWILTGAQSIDSIIKFR